MDSFDRPFTAKYATEVHTDCATLQVPSQIPVQAYVETSCATGHRDLGKIGSHNSNKFQDQLKRKGTRIKVCGAFNAQLHAKIYRLSWLFRSKHRQGVWKTLAFPAVI